MDFVNGQRVLVTGAGGFIGSHLCHALVQRGATVTALCRYTSRRDEGNLAALPDAVRAELDVRFGDMRDRDFVGRLVAGGDAVFNLAASISVPYSFVAPREVAMTNFEGALNVLSAAADSGARVLQMSSSEVYGTAQYTPIDERHPLDAQSPYAASKVGADKLAESFHMAFGVPVVIARPFNTYGPRQSLRAVIAVIVAQALAGGELTLGALTPRRDFVFVADTVEGLIRLLGSDAATQGQTFNIATGTDVSVADVVTVVGELLGRELTVRSADERMRPEKSEVHQLLGSPAKLLELTGWSPQTDLRTGLGAVIEWMRTTGLAARSAEYAV
jgi:nucleoside-diphosphate-sugar epimerase